MKKISHLLPILALLGLLFEWPLFTSPVHAENMSDMAGMPDKHVAMLPHKGEGSVNKVDVAAGTINLTHGPIKSLVGACRT